MKNGKEIAKINTCNHNRRTQNFSDVFGYYETCLDCNNDLDNIIVNVEGKRCFKYLYGFIIGIVTSILLSIIF